eukprot:TRINITY_DN15100_c0_g1_i1.p2 TRINITY_DN15100_c0_g1~~TRINITY_DN15100_c0_g1_i1.p2  ORF type:complete len:236 (-),score=58.77 TRINITY_DN15100_c0_g1_i1:9-716(-)
MPATLEAVKQAPQGKRGKKEKDQDPKSAKSSNEGLPNLKVPASISKDKDMEKLFSLIVKALLHSLQTGRDVCSVLFLTFLVQTTEEVIEQAKEQNLSYSRATEKKGHGLGPPHIWTFGGVLTATVEAIEELGRLDKLDGDADKAMAQWGKRLLKEYGDASKEQKQEWVLFCRVTKTYKEETHRMTLAFGTGEAGVKLKEFICRSFQLLQYEQRFGRAPPSHQERALQQFLEEMAE